MIRLYNGNIFTGLVHCMPPGPNFLIFISFIRIFFKNYMVGIPSGGLVLLLRDIMESAPGGLGAEVISFYKNNLKIRP